MFTDMNYCASTTTNTSDSANCVTSNISAVTGKLIQVLGFDGSSSDQAFKVELKYGSTTKLTMRGSADSTVGRSFGMIGIVPSSSSEVSVVTTPDTTGNCAANLIYRLIF